MMDRESAFSLLQEKVNTDVLIKHCLATEAIMRALARKLGEDEELWGIAALLHDLDFEETRDAPERHTLVALEWLKDSGLPPEALHAIAAHNEEYVDYKRETTFDYALTAAESVTGLIMATALVMPDKKLESVQFKSVKKRIKEKAFARNVSRENIKLCEKFGISLDDFIALSLDAMKGISNQIGF